MYERLYRLNRFASRLNELSDPDEIIYYALAEAPSLGIADEAIFWLWDADQQAPVLMITLAGITPEFSCSDSLLTHLRQAVANRYASEIDAVDADWPHPLPGCTVSFIPLVAHDECQGVIAVMRHDARQRFAYEDVLLLSSLGNTTATALRNAQLQTSQHHLMNLLQTSIRQVVQATSSDVSRPGEFVQSLLQVAEGLTRAYVVCALVHLDEAPLFATSGSLAIGNLEELETLGTWLFDHHAQMTSSNTGILDPDRVFGQKIVPIPLTYALAEVTLGGKSAGFVYALSMAPFDDDQLAFLQTIAEQIEVGIERMRQDTNIRRLLFEFSDVTLFSETISSTLDSHRIMFHLSHYAARAVNLPIALCGWFEDDGTINMDSRAAVDLAADKVDRLQLTTNNAVIRSMIERHTAITSRDVPERIARRFLRDIGPSVKDWVCVPMLVKPQPASNQAVSAVQKKPQRLLGLLIVASRTPREFSPRELALLATYANQAALALDNSLLQQETEHQLRQMESVNRIINELSLTLDLPEVWQKLLYLSTTALESPIAFICLADEHGVQQVAASTGVERMDCLHQLSFERGEGMIGTVGQRGETITSTNLQRDGRANSAMRNLAQAEGWGASVTVALKAHEQISGTLTIIARKMGEIPDDHVRLAETIAIAAAVTMQNARLFAQEQERTVGLGKFIAGIEQRVAGTMALITELITTSQQSESKERLIRRVELVAAVLGVFQENNPANIDLTDVLTRVFHERALRDQREAVRPDIRVQGVHLLLPAREAAALAIAVHEWVMIADERHPGTPILVTLQQFGRDAWIQIDDPAGGEGARTRVNSAIIAMVSRFVPVAISESTEGDTHRVRLRFNRSAFD